MIEIPKDIFADVPSKCKECNHNTTKWLIDHDKQVRNEVVDRFMNLCDAYCHFNKDKHPANGYVISRASLLDIAEKLKGE
jgi:hypothetical protein